MSPEIKLDIADPVNSDQRFIFIENGKILLELRLALTAILDATCNLGGLEILGSNNFKETFLYEWLYELGMEHLDKVDEFEIVRIQQPNVINRELVTPWEVLERIPVD
ncbi:MULTISPECIES: hypothetical protein [Bacillus]|uniref:hypothetical protein n=1 Tax=Bacillus TaxID=1386 RepID=UPI0006A87E62|nr:MULTISPECIES: hypothetical protein [Bacillus]MDY7905284.1 hypothetical protein [Bacillus sp. AG1]QWK24595.1 hypothetical protein KM776_17180 [Bacillus velezensis]CUB45472.1 hypothetical protein BN2127_JRS8_03347 [Bacillus amyloliquefaciens]